MTCPAGASEGTTADDRSFARTRRRPPLVGSDAGDPLGRDGSRRAAGSRARPRGKRGALPPHSWLKREPECPASTRSRAPHAVRTRALRHSDTVGPGGSQAVRRIWRWGRSVVAAAFASLVSRASTLRGKPGGATDRCSLSLRTSPTVSRASVRPCVRADGRAGRGDGTATRGTATRRTSRRGGSRIRRCAPTTQPGGTPSRASMVRGPPLAGTLLSATP